MPKPSDSNTVAESNGTGQGTIMVVGPSVYERLAAPFDVEHHDNRGGVEITYVSGEQVVSRLNEVLTAGGWSFRILQHAIDHDADEVWALGELVAVIDGETVTRQQFGSQKIKRNKPNCGAADADGVVCGDKSWDHDKRHRDHTFTPGMRGPALDLGFDLKGGATDALKKCASLLGVGLYLSRREAPPKPVQQTRQPGPKLQPAVAARPTVAPSVAPPQQITQPAPKGMRFDCEECGGELTEKRFDDGTVWAPGQIAEKSLARFGKVLCFNDLKATIDAPLISKSGASV